MASLERTAYPQFSKAYSPKELQQLFSPSADEQDWLKINARSASTRLGLAVLLKCFQHLWYFPEAEAIPVEIVQYIRKSLGLGERFHVEYPVKATRSRHMSAILEFLQVKPFYANDAMQVTEKLAFEAAALMDQHHDIINAMVDGLVRHRYALPAFSTLNDMAERVHVAVQKGIFGSVFRRISGPHLRALGLLLETDLDRRQTEYNDLKRSAKRPTRKHLDMLVDHLAWLESLGNMEDIFVGVPDTKVRHFAEQAMAYDVSELKECAEPRRYTLMLALILRMQIRARDQLAEMFLRRVATIQKRAKDELELIQHKQRGQVERLIGTLDGVLEILEKEQNDSAAGHQIRDYLAPAGGINQIRLNCSQVQATSGNNYLPLLWKHFKSHRPILFRLVHLLEIEPTSQDMALINALEVIKTYQDKHRIELIEEPIDLSFASDRWRKLLLQPLNGSVGVSRRMLEVCVFCYVTQELRSGDLSVLGSEEFADYRKQLLPWEECEALLPTYCKKVGIPDNAEAFVAKLQESLTAAAEKLDARFPDCRSDVALTANGEPVLRKVTAREIPPSAISLHEALSKRMPPRHLLDILANIEQWMHFTRHFGPLSGNEAKLRDAAERYLMTIFAMGCNLGPTQAARHLASSSGVTAKELSFVNRRHMSLEKLEAAHRQLNEVYLQLDLPKLWGDGKTVAADGTQYDFYDENLLTGQHFRYRKMGAVAYRHVANNFIAVFRHFIPPGVWEAIYVIQGLLEAKLSVEADTVHADTQGQSATVFAFTHLLGIKLMPRIRNWKDLILYRPDKVAKYEHINRLFSETAEWELIERHWQDLMQVALSIYTGKISSPVLLRKLGSKSRKNRLYFAAEQLGNVVRTIFLLEWIGSRELRQEITANTNKMESYNGFAKWLSFGGDVIASNEPDEQQKRLRYNDLIATSLILQNTVDMMRSMRALEAEGWEISDEDVSFLSPYQVGHVKRFGEYNLKLKRTPEDWIRDAAFQQAAAAAQRTRTKKAGKPEE